MHVFNIVYVPLGTEILEALKEWKVHRHQNVSK